MSLRYQDKIDAFMSKVLAKDAHEPVFVQAVQEVADVIIPFMEDNPKYKSSNILDRIVEPERTIIFRVPWTDDNGNIQINRGFRVEFNSAIGPYKGGLRFHPSVNLGILKFLRRRWLENFRKGVDVKISRPSTNFLASKHF